MDILAFFIQGIALNLESWYDMHSRILPFSLSFCHWDKINSFEPTKIILLYVDEDVFIVGVQNYKTACVYHKISSTTHFLGQLKEYAEV